MNLGQIKEYASKLLRDSSFGLFSETEHESNINEGLQELSRDCKYLIDYRYYPLISGTAIYTLDADVLEIERVEFNGKYIHQLDYRNLYEYDSNWMNETGEVGRWYWFGNDKIGYYKKPSWTEDLSTFDSENGCVIDVGTTSDTFTFSSDYGIVVDIDTDNSGDEFYLVPDSSFGEAIWIDEGAYSVCLRCVISAPTLTSDSDVPDLPEWFHKLLVFYDCWRCLDRDSAARKPEIATLWRAFFEWGKLDLSNLYYKSFKTEDGGGEIRPLRRSNKYRHFLTGSN